MVAFLVLLCIHTVSACGGYFTTRYGIVTSPNYSSVASTEYPPNSNCNWTITTPVGTTIVLEVVDFKLHCGNDYIKVTDIFNNKVLHERDRVCDAAYLMKPLFSDSNRIHIHFYSDANNQERGFKMVWRVRSMLTFNSNFATWSEAQTICNQKGGMLTSDVTVYQDEILQKMQERYVTQIWHGQYITPWAWLKGCFQPENWTNFQNFVVLKTNEMKECLKHCSKWNYFGLQNKRCFCFDTFAGESVVTESNCATPCPGNSQERCGGSNFLTVYMNGDVCYNVSTQYEGNVSRTKDGNICLPWKDIRSVTGDSNLVFPDGSADKASNYCRDPDGSGRLWCYVTQDIKELCDVTPCITDDIGKHHQCKAVYTTSNDFVFSTTRCSSRFSSICLGADQPHYVTNSKDSWEVGRTNTRQGSSGSTCKNMVDSSLFYMDKSILKGFQWYWIGYVRAYVTARITEAAGRLDKCFISSVTNDRLDTEGVEDCNSRRHFICEKVPVTCGGQYDDFTNGSFTTPNYPSNYDALMHCIWSVSVPDDHFMILNVYTSMEDSPSCQYDYVKIYEGESADDKRLDTVCGKSTRTYYNITSNITVEFLSDETEQSFGVFVRWFFVNEPMMSLPSLSTTLAPSTDRFHDDKDMNEQKIRLSNGGLAGLIVGIIIVLVVACIVGYLFGRRKRTPLRNDTEKGASGGKTMKDNKRNKDVNLAKINNENKGNESSFHNSGYEADVQTETPLKDGKTTNVPPDERADEDRNAQNKADAVYSQVNKPAKAADTEPKKLAAVSKEPDKQNKTQDDVYNSLNEKAENMYMNKTDNVYNHFNDVDSTYDSTTSPTTPNKDKNVATSLETYDHKK